MYPNERLSLVEIEQLDCDIAANEFALSREDISPRSSLLEEPGSDSLDMIDFVASVSSRMFPELYGNKGRSNASDDNNHPSASLGSELLAAQAPRPRKVLRFELWKSSCLFP
jgi:hypothetical protein